MRRKVEQWQSMEKIGGTMAEEGEGRWNNGRAWERLEEQWQSNEKDGGTEARRTEYGEQYEVGLTMRRQVEQWQSTEEVG